MTKAIQAILFLGTPHGPADIDSISKLLTRTLFTGARFQPHVTDLMRGSKMIQDMNDHFRIMSREIKILSFYETVPIRIGTEKMVGEPLIKERSQSY